MPSLINALNVVDPQVYSNQPAINNNAAFANTANQQLPYYPPPDTFGNVLINFPAPQRNFLSAISEYAASVPLKSFWVMQFNIPSLIVEQNLADLSEKFRGNDFAKYSISNPKLMKNVGCIFCRSFNFPGEVNSSSVPEMDIRGFRSVPYAGGRSSAIFSNFSVSFYESSISFIDHIIRPWTILMSYYSTIVRNDAVLGNKSINDLRQDITCHLMTRTGVGKTQASQNNNIVTNADFNSAIPNYNNPWNTRKTIVFKNCFPKEFSTSDYAQQDSNSLETVLTTFCYTNYEVIHTPFSERGLQLFGS